MGKLTDLVKQRAKDLLPKSKVEKPDAVKPDFVSHKSSQSTQSKPANSIDLPTISSPLRDPEYQKGNFNVKRVKKNDNGVLHIVDDGEEVDNDAEAADESIQQLGDMGNDGLVPQFIHGITHPGEVLDNLFGVNEAIEKDNQKANPYTALNETTMQSKDYYDENGNPATARDVYDNYFSKLNMDDDVQKPEKEKTSSVIGDRASRQFDNLKHEQEMADYYQKTGVDDGKTTEGRTSNYMTGTQYKNYAALGLGGRPVEDIDENAVYSKSDEFENYGFQPYVPDRDTALKMGREQVAAGPTKIVNEFANIREDATDYTIDGLSGKAFDDAALPYFEQSSQQIQDQNRWIYNGSPEFDQIDPNDPNVIPIVNDEWEISFEDGTSRKIRGDYEAYGQEDGSILVQFVDGSEILFEDENDYRTNMVPLEGRNAEEGEEPSLYIPVDPMIVDGQEIPYTKALEYINGGGDRNYDVFGIPNLGKPRYQLQEEGGLFNFSNIVPNFLDLAAGSAPLFTWATSIPTGLSTGEVATHGIDPNTMRADGTSSMLAEDLSQDQYLSNIGASLFMPITEHFAGNIGGGNLLRALPNRFAGKAYQPLVEMATGIGGEALEEVGPGNITEAIQRQGIQNMFADELTDEEGNVITDSTGHPLYADTNFFGRLGNFWEAAPEAAVGGAMLGGAFDLPRIPDYISRANQIRQNNKTGIPTRRELENVNQLTDEQIDYMFGRER